MNYPWPSDALGTCVLTIAMTYCTNRTSTSALMPGSFALQYPERHFNVLQPPSPAIYGGPLPYMRVQILENRGLVGSVFQTSMPDLCLSPWSDSASDFMARMRPAKLQDLIAGQQHFSHKITRSLRICSQGLLATSKALAEQ